jgi:Cu+-exporting ATPase
MVGIGKGARVGVLVKNAEALEKLSKVDLVVLDKTGTLTEGKPRLTAVVPLGNWREEQLIQLAASLEVGSEHPLSVAIVTKAQAAQLPLLPLEGFKAVSGQGVVGQVAGYSIGIGNQRLFQELKIDVSSVMSQASPLLREGQAVLYISINGQVAGLFAVADTIKPFTREAVAMLHGDEIRLLMLTGDHPSAAIAIGKQLQIDEVKAEVLPGDKYRIIKELQADGRVVAMAGDGINDAPALAQADVGIAMGTGTDIAIESGGITLVKGDLRGIARARTLSLATMRNIRQNLWFAFVYNALGVPIATGLLYPFLGVLLSPIIASAAMTLSSVSVILNSFRLSKLKL